MERGGVENGEWRVKSGEWLKKGRGWRVENGERRVEGRVWRVNINARHSTTRMECTLRKKCCQVKGWYWFLKDNFLSRFQAED